jgi:hypothetical protein
MPSCVIAGILRGISEGEVMAMMKRLTWLALVAGTIGSTIAAQVATATHPRPKAASPVRVSLVPAYEQCTAPNRTHGPPLAFPSCNPPSEASDSVTVGTPDANGAPPNATGFWKLKVDLGAGPAPVLVSFEVKDVRCKAGTSACGDANASGGPDYTGELQANATIRITDHDNSTAPGGGTDAATVVDIPMPVTVDCTSTADTSIGGHCTITGGGVQPAIPDCCRGDRMIIEVGQVRVDDGGADGVVTTAPNTVFMRQGIFVP